MALTARAPSTTLLNDFGSELLSAQEGAPSEITRLTVKNSWQ
jgi:hypothetical protein